jgi:hypothetical protein
MTATETTLADLLAEGRAALAAKAAEEARRRADADEAKAARWAKLRADMAPVLGPIAGLIPDAPPDGLEFSGDTSYVELRLTPFGRAPLAVCCATKLDGDDWYAFRRGQYARHDHTFGVPAGVRPALDDDAGRYYVRVTGEEQTDSLAEALALCERAEADWQACEAECERRTAQHAAKRLSAKPMPTAGERLLAALGEWLDEREAGLGD